MSTYVVETGESFRAKIDIYCEVVGSSTSGGQGDIPRRPGLSPTGAGGLCRVVGPVLGYQVVPNIVNCEAHCSWKEDNVTFSNVLFPLLVQVRQTKKQTNTLTCPYI